MSAPATERPAGLDADEVVVMLLAELARRRALPTFGPATLPKAREAASRLLWTLGVEDCGDPIAPVVDLAAHRAAVGGGRDGRA